MALFQEMASTPATLDAARIADAYACFEGNHMSTRDVEQAYLQAELKGPQTWIMLPSEIWKDEMFGMRCPVVRLEKALYGHKHSGNFWEDECFKQCSQAGFESLGEEWPGVFWDPKNFLLLVVYVDDMKLSGPRDRLADGWERLNQHLNLEVPKSDEDPNECTFLGCTTAFSETVTKDGVKPKMATSQDSGKVQECC